MPNQSPKNSGTKNAQNAGVLNLTLRRAVSKKMAVFIGEDSSILGTCLKCDR